MVGPLIHLANGRNELVGDPSLCQDRKHVGQLEVGKGAGKIQEEVPRFVGRGKAGKRSHFQLQDGVD
eukprot:5360637-Lingulodinium_polyedra.AAC.1